MSAEAIRSNRSLTTQLRLMLLELAHDEDECAANEAAAQPYWEACPASVHGHRVAAVALRERADRLLASVAPALAGLGESA